MAITLRQESNAQATTKGSALTFSELDNNFIHVLTNGLIVVGDDSTGTEFTLGNTLTVAGGTGITTAVSGNTLTITASGGGLSNIVEDTTPQLGGNLDVNGNSIVSVSNADITINPDGTGAVIIGGDLHVGGDTESTISVDGANNALELQGPSNGYVVAGGTHSDVNTSFGSNYEFGGLSYAEFTSLTPGTGTRHYANGNLLKVQLDGTNSSSTSDRYRNNSEITLDLNGSEITATGFTRGVANHFASFIENTSATAGVMGEVAGMRSSAGITNLTGNVSITNMYGAYVDSYAEGSTTQTVTNSYGVKFDGMIDDTGGNLTVTNEYGYYYGNENSATNTYAFYSANETAKSHLGTIARYRENVVSLADDSTADVTVDYNTSQIHTYTIEDAKEFRFDNIPTGGTVTLIITQSQGGSHTATFVNGADSTAVKFAGGAPTITTADGSIDVVTVFNDGTNLLGNIAQDFKSA